MMLSFRVTTRFGTTYTVDACDADDAMRKVRAMMRQRYPSHIPPATAERYTSSDMEGATVTRAPKGIAR